MTNINHLQPINSTELQKSSNQEVNLTFQLLPNFKTPPPRLQRHSLDHFNTEHVILSTSIQKSQQNQNNQQKIQMTAQQLRMFFRQFYTQSNQAATNAPIGFIYNYLQAALTQTPTQRENKITNDVSISRRLRSLCYNHKDHLTVKIIHLHNS